MLRILSSMSRSHRTLNLSAAARTSMISRHVSSVPRSGPSGEPSVLFESNLSSRTYTLNRVDKLNAVDRDMIRSLRSKIQEWDTAKLCQVIVGTGNGRAFCAGGDITTIMELAKSEDTRADAVSFFKDEFELNFLLGNLSKPYVVIVDGITMGGGLGLSIHAPFRVATENTVIAMPETIIGYFPDVGANYFFSRLDGEIGTYLCLTGKTLKGRAVFEHGIATHYIPARRVADLQNRLSSLENASPYLVDAAIEELHFERGPEEPPPPLIGEKRVALDAAFSKKTVEEIFEALGTFASREDEIGSWAKETIADLNKRSPTSLKVALRAIRKGKRMPLGDVLQMEMGLATAFVSGATPDMNIGITARLVEKSKDRPQWSPETLSGVSDADILQKFFTQESPFRKNEPRLDLSHAGSKPWPSYALPSEDEIGQMVLGSHPTSGGTGLTQKELLARFDELRGGKHGVKEKILEVSGRRCRIYEDPERQGCLEWVH